MFVFQSQTYSPSFLGSATSVKIMLNSFGADESKMSKTYGQIAPYVVSELSQHTSTKKLEATFNSLNNLDFSKTPNRNELKQRAKFISDMHKSEKFEATTKEFVDQMGATLRKYHVSSAWDSLSDQQKIDACYDILGMIKVHIVNNMDMSMLNEKQRESLLNDLDTTLNLTFSIFNDSLVKSVEANIQEGNKKSSRSDARPPPELSQENLDILGGYAASLAASIVVEKDKKQRSKMLKDAQVSNYAKFIDASEELANISYSTYLDLLSMRMDTESKGFFAENRPVPNVGAAIQRAQFLRSKQENDIIDAKEDGLEKSKEA